MTSRFLLGSVVSVLLAGAAHAASHALDCNGVAPGAGMKNIALAQVTTKANFVRNESERPHCPTTDAACRRRGFLLAGDIAVSELSTGAAGPYVCVAYLNPKGNESDGWFPAAALKPSLPAPNWAGKWKRDTSSEIEIRAEGATVHLGGHATANSGSAVNEGDIDADIDARAAYASFALRGDKQVAFAKAGRDDCAVELRQLGPYLLVQDNNNCGGMGVSFSGLYRRR